MKMTKRLLLVSSLCLLGGGVLASCGGNNPAPAQTSPDMTFTVTFDTKGGSAVEAQSVKYGQKASKPADPTKADHTFAGWYADEACKVSFDFNQEITADWTVYALWTGGAPASSSEEMTSQEQSISTPELTSEAGEGWTFTFVDAGWWNDSAAGTTYTLSPSADGKGTTSTTLATYDTATGYDPVAKTNHWFVEIPAGTASLQLFRTNGTGADDWNARTVVIDLSARDGKTVWALDGNATWYDGANFASGHWVE